MNRQLRAAILGTVLCWALSVPIALAAPAQKQSANDILQYISSAWDTLTRSMNTCNEVVDPKSPERSFLYLPADFAVPENVEDLAKRCQIHVTHLPKVIQHLGEIRSGDVTAPGLLYLPHPYVVPGGRFNEMYGWDSYFIIRGLLRDGRLGLARGMVENFFFEIDHYGGVLNANRTYYLTRSQPPFLTSMILAVYEMEKAKGEDPRAWLTKAYPYAARDYRLWTHAPHLAADTGLARYYDFGEGPVPEMGDSPGYYRGVARYFLAHPNQADSYLVRSVVNAPHPATIGPVFSLQVCEPDATSIKDCDRIDGLSLSRDYYKGDRAMRESGFDVSFRFGPYSAAAHRYAGVGLNCLLYKTETDLAQMSTLLGRTSEAAEWKARAAKRRAAVDRYLWNGTRGLFFAYNFDARRQSSYVYATTLYPLWTGLASPAQAQAVERNLKLLEQPGGIAMSKTDSGAQWDYPYGWAPVNMIDIEGLRRYGFNADADRLSYNFLSTILENFRRDGTIREKYNVVTRSSETHVAAGYTQNVVGFGWTNAAYVVLLDKLPAALRDRLAEK